MLKYKIVQDPYPCSPDEWHNPSSGVWLVARARGSLHTGEIAGSSEGYESFPVWGYKHSGLVLSLKPFVCPWDSGQAGEVFVTRDRNQIPDPRAAAEACIQEWNQYLAGDVWLALVYDDSLSSGDGRDGNHLEACGGLYGREHAEEVGARMLAEAVETVGDEERKIDLCWAD